MSVVDAVHYDDLNEKSSTKTGALHKDTLPRANAADLWDHAQAMGLQRFANGQVPGEQLQPDDNVVFNRKPTQTAGRVAIVVVASDTSAQLFTPQTFMGRRALLDDSMPKKA